jgi:hypothetical protein
MSCTAPLIPKPFPGLTSSISIFQIAVALRCSFVLTDEFQGLLLIRIAFTHLIMRLKSFLPLPAVLCYIHSCLAFNPCWLLVSGFPCTDKLAVAIIEMLAGK